MHNGKNCVGCSAPLIGRQRKHCSEQCRMSFLNKKFQNYQNQLDRGRFAKLKAVKDFGGKCINCGYCRNLAALCFHHERDKKFGLTFREFANRSPQSIKEELKKCVLLCQNCHNEHHNPDHFI
jgi:hypothetical protein